MKAEDLLTSFIIFGLFIGLSLAIYNNLQNDYGFTTTDKSVMVKLNQTVFGEGINGVKDSIETFAAEVANFETPTQLVLGSFEVLKSATIGILKLLVGAALLPQQLITTIGSYFGLPGGWSNFLGLIGQIYIVMLLYSLIRGG